MCLGAESLKLMQEEKKLWEMGGLTYFLALPGGLDDIRQPAERWHAAGERFRGVVVFSGQGHSPASIEWVPLITSRPLTSAWNDMVNFADIPLCSHVVGSINTGLGLR